MTRKLVPVLPDKICAVPGCSKALTADNTSGVCRAHCHAAECGCKYCDARRADKPFQPEPLTKVFTPAQERAAAELRRLNGWPERGPPKQEVGRRLTAVPPADWRGEHLIRGR